MFASASNFVLLVVAGTATGVLGSILGTGGGVFLIPFLVLGLGIPMHYAVATSIVSVIATSSAAAISNIERGTANMRLGMVLEIATALGAISGGLTSAQLAPGVLEGLFSVVIIPTAILMWRGRGEDEWSEGGTAEESGASSKPASETEHGILGATYTDEATALPVSYRVKRLPAGLGISFIAGNLSGLLGIGGGVFKVPALHLLCGVPIKAAAATSNFMIGVTAAASAFLYYGRGEVRPALTATVVLGVLAGSFWGTRLNRYIHGHSVRRLFAVLLFGVALQMAYRSFASGV